MPKKYDDDDDMMDRARAFWEHETGKGRVGNDDKYPFLGGDYSSDSGNYENEEQDFSDNMRGLLDNDPEHVDAELAFSGYDLSQMEDAIEYCRDAPLGVLKISIVDNEIEIWRYPS